MVKSNDDAKVRMTSVIGFKHGGACNRLRIKGGPGKFHASDSAKRVHLRMRNRTRVSYK